MSNDTFDRFYNEFKDWSKEDILRRTYNIILDDADKTRQIEQLEERCEYLERSNNRREEEIMELRDENVDLVSKNNKLENIRKEAIEYTEENCTDYLDENGKIKYSLVVAKPLLNILNKGSE